MMKKIIPNAITIIRMCLALSLLLFAPLSPGFLVVYLLAGASDILDGFFARRWNVSSRIGAYLDSAADFLLFAVLLLVFIPLLVWPLWIICGMAAIAVIRIAAIVVCYIKFQRIAILHTYLNKATGFLLLFFPFLLLLFSFDFIAAFLCIVASLSALEEFVIMIASTTLQPDRPTIFKK